MTDNGPVYRFGRDILLGEIVVIRTFQCARCGRLCETSTTEAEANREFMNSGITTDYEIVSVCDDCYDYVMTRASEDGLLVTNDLILGMTASRNKPSDKQLDWLFSQVEKASELHHGACVGGDEAGHDAAIEVGIDIVVHPPSKQVLMMNELKFKLRDRIYVMEPKPYHDRNRDIVDDCDRMIALPDGPRRPHSGTWYTIGYAEQKGKPVTICYPDGLTEELNVTGVDSGGG